MRERERGRKGENEIEKGEMIIMGKGEKEREMRREGRLKRKMIIGKGEKEKERENGDRKWKC